jgi:putative intracellular protease/amidase
MFEWAKLLAGGKRRVLKNGGFTAGICNGALVIGSAGVLIGKRCTHTAHPKYAPLPEFKELLDFAEDAFKGSTYVDEDVVIDGNIITAKPYAADSLAKAVAAKVANAR